MRPPCSPPRQGHNQIIVLNQDLKSNIIHFRCSLCISNLANSGHSTVFQTTNKFSNYRSAQILPQFNPRNITVQITVYTQGHSNVRSFERCVIHMEMFYVLLFLLILLMTEIMIWYCRNYVCE